MQHGYRMRRPQAVPGVVPSMQQVSDYIAPASTVALLPLPAGRACTATLGCAFLYLQLPLPLHCTLYADESYRPELRFARTPGTIIKRKRHGQLLPAEAQAAAAVADKVCLDECVMATVC